MPGQRLNLETTTDIEEMMITRARITAALLEYFAEGTEAYFYRNDFYPFVRAELKDHDPVLRDLL